MNTISNDELSRFIKRQSISPRKLADWRDEGLIPRPVRSKGLGRGEGRVYEYPENVLGRLKTLVDLTSRYRSYDEIRWKLLLLGNTDQWQYLQGLLVKSFPPDVTPLNANDEENIVHKEFPRFWKDITRRYNPFPFFDKDKIIYGVKYLIWPYWYKSIAPYSVEDGLERNFEELFGSKTHQLHKKWVESKLTDLKKLRNVLENAKEQDVLKAVPDLRLLDEKIEHPENKKAYRFFHVSIPGIPVRPIWMARAFILAMRCLETSPDSKVENVNTKFRI